MEKKIRIVILFSCELASRHESVWLKMSGVYSWVRLASLQFVYALNTDSKWFKQQWIAQVASWIFFGPENDDDGSLFTRLALDCIFISSAIDFGFDLHDRTTTTSRFLFYFDHFEFPNSVRLRWRPRLKSIHLPYFISHWLNSFDFFQSLICVIQLHHSI